MNASVSNGTIGVVIRTLNESELIGRCLETLRGQQGGFELDVLVVDSGSTDSTLEIARERGARILEFAPDGVRLLEGAQRRDRSRFAAI